MLAENVSHVTDDGQLHSSTFLDLSDLICKNVSMEMRDSLDFETVYSKNLYVYFPGKNTFVPLSPFFVYRDGHYFYYSSIDNKSYPVYNEVFSTKYISIRKYESAFKQ